MALPISATVVVHNEEEKIEKCFSSLKGIVDEIILVHDGPCTDKTLEIAKNFTKKIFVQNFIGEAEPHRRFSWEKAKNNWVLQIDADEYLTNELRKNLRGLISDSTVSGYRFKWNIAFSGERKFYDYKLALYNKKMIKQFFGIPHETVKLKGKIITLNDIELGHDRGISAGEKFYHKLTVWPQVHGHYAARFQYTQAPLFILPLGYIFYPLFKVIFSLLQGKTRSVHGVWCDVVYGFLFWHFFFVERFRIFLKSFE